MPACRAAAAISTSASPTAKTGKNAFFDPKAENGLSALGASFTEGILAHAPAMMPLINPTPNCYHRVKPYTFAPSNVSWGVQDRSAMVRIKATGDERTHLEMRGGSAASNPYLLAAAVLAAGLPACKAKAKLRDAVARHDQRGQSGAAEIPADARRRPRRARGRRRDARAGSARSSSRSSSAVKRFELARFHAHVTDWEVNEYLELY